MIKNIPFAFVVGLQCIVYTLLMGLIDGTMALNIISQCSVLELHNNSEPVYYTTRRIRE